MRFSAVVSFWPFTFSVLAPPSCQIPAQSSASTKCSPGSGYAYSNVQSNSSTWPWRTFKSSSLLPPNLSITTNKPDLAPGYFFLTPESIGNTPATRQSGVFIFTSDNEPLFGSGPERAKDFRVQEVNGTSYLTFWNGTSGTGTNTGHGAGQVTFLDQNYTTAFSICPDLHINTQSDPPPPCQIDIHEHQVTPWGTILVSAYNATPTDLTSINGSSVGWIQDSLFFEVDIATSDVLYSWSSLDYVPVNASHLPLVTSSANGTEAAPFDYFHINSVVPVGRDHFLVNARHTWSVYLISRHDGSIVWTLAGDTGGDFGALPDDAHFRWQHYARTQNVTDSSLILSLFNNANEEVDNGTAPSNALMLYLDLPPNKTVSPTLLRNLEVPGDDLYAESQGNYVPDLPNGNQVVGYGQISIVREFGPDGDLRWQAQFGGNNIVQNYRGFKQVWHATPSQWDPALAVEKEADAACGALGYASWNGATEVEGWNVYAYDEGEDEVLLGTVEKKGFETVFDVPASGYVVIGAVERGVEVRRSNVVRL